MNRKKLYLTFAMIFSCLGLVAGLIVNNLTTNGYFSKWLQVPAPENNTFELVGTTWGGVVIRTESSEILYCHKFRYFCEKPQFSLNRIENSAGTCDFNSPAFSSITNPPQTIENCIQGILLAADSTTNSIAVIDETNQLWLWQESHDGFMEWISIPLTICFSTLVGLFIGSLLFGLVLLKRVFVKTAV